VVVGIVALLVAAVLVVVVALAVAVSTAVTVLAAAAVVVKITNKRTAYSKSTVRVEQPTELHTARAQSVLNSQQNCIQQEHSPC
jgi:hypothetical protein